MSTQAVVRSSTKDKSVAAYPPEWFWIGLALTLGAWQSWIYRYCSSSDGVSYLDLSDAFASGRLLDGINRLWSPLLPAVLGLFRAMTGSRLGGDMQVGHFVMFLSYILALMTFSVLVQEISRVRWSLPQGAGGYTYPAQGPFVAWAYLTFLWISLDLVRLSKITPDMLVAACLFLAAAMVVRVLYNRSRTTDWLTLGAALGCGYLSKAAVASVAVFVFSLLFWWQRRHALAWTRVAAGLGAFVVLAGFYVVPLSWRAGKLSLGEAGRLNFLWHINGIPDTHWRGGGTLGTLRHPTRILARDPLVYEFNGPVEGTYPVWLDPAYWYDGATPSFHASQYLQALSGCFRDVARDLFVSRNAVMGWPFLAFASIQVVTCVWRRYPGERWQHALNLIAIIGIATYLAIHIETRYIAAPIAMIALSSSGCLPLREPLRLGRNIDRTVWAAVAFLAVSFCATTAVAAYRMGVGAEPGQGVTSAAPQLIAALERLNMWPGDRVALLGNPFEVSWARQRRVRIVAEIPPNQAGRVWSSLRETPTDFANLLLRSGAKWLVCATAPPPDLLQANTVLRAGHLFVLSLNDLQHRKFTATPVGSHE